MVSAVVGLFAVACVNEDVEQVAGQQEGFGHVNINVLDADLISKAASSTTAQEYEKVVRNVLVLVFDENDLLIYYHDAGTSVSNITLYVAEGRKDVWAVVNGPSLKSVSKKNQLTEYAVGLDAYNDLTGSKGFLMPRLRYGQTVQSPCLVVAPVLLWCQGRPSGMSVLAAVGSGPVPDCCR